MTRLARAAVGAALVSGSCLVGLALTEVALRLFFPRYEHAAEARPDSHPTRIWARSADTKWQMRHPDTGLYHAFNHNSLALRHDRDFGAADLDAAVNVGLFGDSFTENYLLPSAYSLNEPLDFLLNTSGERFNVLNFGVSGYGTGQSFLRHEEFRPVRDLDYVFYLFTENDIENIAQTRLFYLDDAGGLRRREEVHSSRWTRFASRFHVTYLLLDIRQRFDFLSRAAFFDREAEHFLRFGSPGDWTLPVSIAWWLNEDEVANSAAVFKALVRRWRRAVEDAGGRFRVVVLPTPTSQRMLAVIGSEAGMIDLNECYRGYDATHANSRDDLQEQWRRSPYRFRNDGHWNEAGNLLAAVCLYRWLEQDANLPRLSEDGLREALYRYYAAFRERETGWMPGGRWTKAVPMSPAEAVGIRRKYSAFDDQEGDLFNYAALLPGGDTPGTLDRVGVDVRIDGNRVVYAKAPPCRADPGAPFFLHVAPSYRNDLAPERREPGFDNLGIPDDFWRAEQNRCVGERRLPSYDVASLRTGQFDPQTGAVMWSADFQAGGAFDPPTGVATGEADDQEGDVFNHAALRPDDDTLGTLDRVGVDVRIDGNRVVYAKAPPCRADPGAPFFLHVVPSSRNDLVPERREHGFDNLRVPDDFWRAEQNRCVGERRLPSYDVASLRTGQFDPQTGVPMWGASFRVEE